MSIEQPVFKITSDYEFYCYLKANLPKGFAIEAEPDTSYYSEWKYRYILYHGDRALKEFAGNFKEIKKGSLVEEAERTLKNIKEHGTC